MRLKVIPIYLNFNEPYMGPGRPKWPPQKEEKLRHSYCVEFDVFPGGLEASPVA
jgi:hypothetical protein